MLFIEEDICHETNVPQEVRIQVIADDQMVEYDAQLVWARINEKGRMEYGLKRFTGKNS